MNRVESKRFPDTVCDVVKQPKQFSWYPRYSLTYGKQKEFATAFLEGKHKRAVPKSYFFTAVSRWLKRPVRITIGGHRFYGI